MPTWDSAQLHILSQVLEQEQMMMMPDYSIDWHGDVLLSALATGKIQLQVV